VIGADEVDVGQVWDVEARYTLSPDGGGGMLVGKHMFRYHSIYLFLSFFLPLFCFVFLFSYQRKSRNGAMLVSSPLLGSDLIVILIA